MVCVGEKLAEKVTFEMKFYFSTQVPTNIHFKVRWSVLCSSVVGWCEADHSGSSFGTLFNQDQENTLAFASWIVLVVKQQRTAVTWENGPGKSIIVNHVK